MARRTPISLHDAAERLGVHYMTAYRYVRTGRLPATRDGVEWRVDPADLDELIEGSTKPAPRGSRGKAAERLEHRLVAGDGAGAWAVVEGALVSGASPREIHLELLSPALRSIGSRWARGELSIAEEHRASVTAQRLLGQLGPRFAHRGRTRGSVVLGGPAGEQHALPSAMLADLLRDARFTAVDLGANTPAESFVEAARAADRLMAVCIGATSSGHDAALADTIAELRGAGITAPLVVGGAAIADAAHAERLGADVWTGSDARAAVEVIEAAAKAAMTTSPTLRKGRTRSARSSLGQE